MYSIFARGRISAAERCSLHLTFTLSFSETCATQTRNGERSPLASNLLATKAVTRRFFGAVSYILLVTSFRLATPSQPDGECKFWPSNQMVVAR